MSEEVNRSEFDRPALRHVYHRNISGCLRRKFKASAALPAKSMISLMRSRNNSWYLLKVAEAMNIKTNYWLDHRCCMNIAWRTARCAIKVVDSGEKLNAFKFEPRRGSARG
jgi:hypothetical protein